MTSGLVLAADIGGTLMRAALVDEKGQLVARQAAETPPHADAPAAFVDLVRAVAGEKPGEVTRAVVGLPGAVDYETGRLLWAPNLPERWPDLLSQDELSAGLGLPVSVANDADLAAVGEAWFGSGMGLPDMGYLTVSTGIGAGIVERGRLLRGVRSLGELGHTVIDWQAWASRDDRAPSRSWARAAGWPGWPANAAWAISTPAAWRTAAAGGDEAAAAIWQGAIVAGAVAIVNLVMSFYPSTVVIGGGIGRQPSYFEAVRSLVQRRFDHYLDVLTVVPGSLGDDAGLVGGRRLGSTRPGLEASERRARRLAGRSTISPRIVGPAPRSVAAPLLGAPAAPRVAGRSPAHHGRAASRTPSAVMGQFRALAAAGRGPVGVILPKATRPRSSTAPALVKSLEAAGLKKSQFVVQDAGGSDATQLAEAETDIARGSRVLVLDPINSGVGTQIEVEAQTKGVKTIDFDDLSLGGSRDYYVGYDQETAGRLLVKGLARCATSWHVRRPRILVLPGPANDGAASRVAQGYDAALQPLAPRARLERGGPDRAGTADPPTAASEFQTAYAANPGVNAALASSDGTDAAIVAVLQAAHVRPRTFPTAGIGSTLAGLQNVLSGYQCGTVAMPPTPEAEAATALALYLRAGQRPPSRLVNAGVEDTTAAVTVPSVLVTPQWVTASNMASTALKDGEVMAPQLCSGSLAAACRAAGIKP